jgi:hypothetical protein
VVWLLAYPLALFLAAPWAQSLLVAIAVWTFIAIERRLWALAALGVVLACLTHITGACLAVALVWCWGKALAERDKADTRLRHLLVEPAVVFFAAPTGVGLWLVYQIMHYHGQVVSFRDQITYFGHHLVWPGLGLWLLVQNVANVTISHKTDLPRLLVDVVPFVSMLATAIYASIRKLWPVHHGLYVFALLTLIICVPVYGPGQQFPDVIVSAGRYLLAAIPIWLLLPQLRISPRVAHGLLVVGICLEACLCLYYLLGGWMV